MQIKKYILFSAALVIVAAWLSIAANINTTIPAPAKTSCSLPKKCCKNYQQQRHLTTPWNFITQGILHVTV